MPHHWLKMRFHADYSVAFILCVAREVAWRAKLTITWLIVTSHRGFIFFLCAAQLCSVFCYQQHNKIKTMCMCTRKGLCTPAMQLISPSLPLSPLFYAYLKHFLILQRTIDTKAFLFIAWKLNETFKHKCNLNFTLLLLPPPPLALSLTAVVACFILFCLLLWLFSSSL